MGTRTGNPTWQNYPSTATLISAARLEAIETAIDASAAVADAVPLGTSTPLADQGSGYAGTTAAASHDDHRHPQLNLGFYPVPASSSGIWFTPLGPQNSANIADVKCPGTPLPVPRPFHIKAVAFRMQNAADGGNWKLAVYASDTAGLPTGAPVWTSAAQSVLTAGNASVSGLDVALTTVDMCWLFFGSYGFTTTRGRPGAALGGVNYLPLVGAANYSQGLSLNGYNETTGAFPTLASYDFSNTNIATLWGYEMQGDLS